MIGTLRIVYTKGLTSTYDCMFLDFFLDRGHDVHVFTLERLETLGKLTSSERDELQSRGLKLHYEFGDRILGLFRRGFLLDFVGIPKLRSFIKKIEPDILLGHWIPSYGFYSALSSFHPFVLFIWGTDILVLAQNLISVRLKAMYSLRVADMVVLDSEVQREATVRVGCSARKIFSFPWAVDLAMFNDSISGEEGRRKWGLENKVVVLFARAHEPRYGIADFFRAVNRIVNTQKNVFFLIAGSGSLTEGLRNFVNRKGLDKYVTFLGQVPHREMPRLMAISDIYVSTSLTDGASATLLEAMAMGKPVVVTDILGNREWVKHMKNGLLISVNSPVQLASSILQLASDEHLRTSLAKNAIEVVKKRADLMANLIRFETAMKRLVK